MLSTRGSSSKESACNAGDTGDMGLIPGSGRSPGGGHGNPLQYSCWENSMDRGAWWTMIHGDTTESTEHTRMCTHSINSGGLGESFC